MIATDTGRDEAQAEPARHGVPGLEPWNEKRAGVGELRDVSPQSAWANALGLTASVKAD